MATYDRVSLPFELAPQQYIQFILAYLATFGALHGHTMARTHGNAFVIQFHTVIRTNVHLDITLKNGQTDGGLVNGQALANAVATTRRESHNM
jgi:hypothetical protein